jgi:hypothetical protein
MNSPGPVRERCGARFVVCCRPDPSAQLHVIIRLGGLCAFASNTAATAAGSQVFRLIKNCRQVYSLDHFVTAQLCKTTWQLHKKSYYFVAKVVKAV